ncbi:hypothetical protein [Synechocystis sp. PCC 7509]|uniref:hypothetical protein n=1 Tax=Synechocystis sp. PCC 7509 TaxID=927677 RepID=UPI0002AC8BC8|nr:hypothetical protein [Synechocystis sp. PCC 7509]
MKSKAIAINPRDGFDLLAVWEKDGRKWYLLQLARPQSAIALYWANPKARLVFPTGVNPNHLEQKILKTNSRKTKDGNYSVGADKLNCINGHHQSR